MNIPRRRKRERMGVRESSVVRCQGHLKWIRGLECAVAGKMTGRGVPHVCDGRMEAHHVQSFHLTEGGMGMKVGDDKAIPLCSNAHQGIHSNGQATTEAIYQMDFAKLAGALWDASPHGRKYRLGEHQ